MTRAPMSMPPPAVPATRMLTVLPLKNSCADAGALTTMAAANVSKLR